MIAQSEGRGQAAYSHTVASVSYCIFTSHGNDMKIKEDNPSRYLASCLAGGKHPVHVS